MTGSPRFSVVIPTYNRVDLLRRTLDSVFAQECTDYEVIVVDDGSTDETPDLLLELGDRVRALRQANQGPSAARNLGIAHARGEYVCTLDSDDLWFPWTLATFAHAIDYGCRPALVAGALVTFESEEELASIDRCPPHFEVYRDYLASSRRGYWVGSGVAAYSRELLSKHGGFDRGLINMEDHDLALRLGVERGFVQILAPRTLAYRRHPGSIQTLDRAAGGLATLVEREHAGRYPGGAGRRRERRRLLGFRARPLAVDCLRARRTELAWRIYRQTFAWHVCERRLRFLLGLPALELQARVCPTGWREA